MKTRTASIKETGEELSQADWERFDAAIAEEKAKANNSKSSIPRGAVPQPAADAVDPHATMQADDL